MTIQFYPQDDVNVALDEKLEILLEAAERYKAIATDPAQPVSQNTIPADLKIAYNWDSLAGVLREVRQMTELVANEKQLKGERLMKLAEIYEVLRGAKMQKLEAVRLALVHEANQLRGLS